MLASTMQFSSNERTPTPHPTPTPTTRKPRQRYMRRPAHQKEQNQPVPSGPNSVPQPQPHRCEPFPTTPPTNNPWTARCTQNQPAEPEAYVDVPPSSGPTTTNGQSRPLLTDPHPPHGRQRNRQVILRKEVIQPHLPVRLPCYDFVPIASPTFDSSLPTRGLGHRLRVLPTFVT